MTRTAASGAEVYPWPPAVTEVREQVDHPELVREPELVFYCPDCARREFGRPR